MSKTIILLSDGTSNAAANPHKTNVWRIYQALDCSLDDNHKQKQIAFYDDGVGNSSFFPIRILGMVFGLGLKKNVLELYENLCRVYEDGDEIAIYGFSRGAFTARVLAALIGSQGILRNNGNIKDLKNEVSSTYRNFRIDSFERSFLFKILGLFGFFNKIEIGKEKYHLPKEEGPHLIKFLGVWDTVDAYGAPIDEITRAWDTLIWPLQAKDRNLSRQVGAAYHALALDEQRESFEPMLWNENVEKSGPGEKPKLTSIIEQVWFCGVHSNIGGGYPDDALSFVPLNWMIRNSENHGLSFKDELREQYKLSEDPYGRMYDNRSGMGYFYRYAPRKIEQLSNDERFGWTSSFYRVTKSKKLYKNEVKISNPKIHHTVFDRIKNGGFAYAPIGLPEHYSVVDKAGKTISQPASPRFSRLIETTSQASQRRSQQGSIWNKVWAGKLLYLIIFFSAATYILYPTLKQFSNDPSVPRIATLADPFFGGLSEVVRTGLQYIGKIPGLGLIESWAISYREYPYVFVFGFAFLWIGLVCSGKLRVNIHKDMRQKWVHISGKNTATDDGNKKQSLLTRFLDGRFDSKSKKMKYSLADDIQWFVRLCLEVVAGLVFIAAFLIIAWKVFFVSQDAFGYACPKAEKSNGTIEFNSKDFCFDTGFALRKNVKYEVSFSINGEWSDKKIPADVNGWQESPPWYLHLATPLRRHYSIDWYVPVLRVGNTWFERYSVGEQDQKNEKPKKPNLQKLYRFTAKSDGNLYVYLNDAVAPWPMAIEYFYSNNLGTATVTISEQ